MNSSSVTTGVVDLGSELVPEGQLWPATEPSGVGEREDIVGNDASGLGCEGRVVGSVVWGTGRVARGSLFDASIYYI